jgi:hypothetical protein
MVLCNDQILVLNSLFQRGLSISCVRKEAKNLGINVSRATIGRYRIKLQSAGHTNENNQTTCKTRGVHHETRGRPSKLNKIRLERLEKFLQKANPPTHRYMAQSLGVSKGCIEYQIRKLNIIRRSKRAVNALDNRKIKLRRVRSRRFYQWLIGEKWKNIITTDEFFFHLSDANQDRPFHYIRKDQKVARMCKFRRSNFSKGVMVWAGISFEGKTQIRFVRPGAKINSEYYIEEILKPFINEDIPKLYPNKNAIFHQDSAPSHVSNLTLNFLRSTPIHFIPPEDWPPNSPDIAPMDYSIWGFMKHKLQKKKVTTLIGLKKAIIDIWNNIPERLVKNTLKSWKKRVTLLIKNKGKQIEHLLR